MCFIPDYTHINQMLLPDGVQHLNDLTLARHAQSQELAELYSADSSRSVDAPTIIDYDGLDDEQLFNSCVPRDVQSAEEYLDYLKD